MGVLASMLRAALPAASASSVFSCKFAVLTADQHSARTPISNISKN
jgi:hypothetical protein